AAPVAAVERIGADEVDGAGDVASAALCHHQQDIVGHALADQRIEGAGQVGAAPFAAAGIHVESEELVPDVFGEVAAGEPVYGDAALERGPALLLQRLALARGQRVQKSVVVAITLIDEVELLVGPA